jgi:hypothetical protein
MSTTRDRTWVFPAALHAATRASAIPYGYTITVWCSGAALMYRHGPPTPGHAFLFLTGAFAAFAALSIPACAATRWSLEVSARAHVLTGVLNLGGAAAGVGLADLIARWDSGAAWILASFAATVAYLLFAAVGLTVTRTIG